MRTTVTLDDAMVAKAAELDGSQGDLCAGA